MFIGVGNPIPRIANLPGASRPGGGGGGGGGTSVGKVDNLYSYEFDASDSTYIVLSNFTSGFTSEANTNNGFSVSVWVNIANVISVNWYLLGAGINSNGPFTLQGTGPNVRFSMIDG